MKDPPRARKRPSSRRNKLPAMSDQFKSRVVRGMGWSAVQVGGGRLISFLVFPVLMRLLGPEAYGLVAGAGVFLALLDVFSDVSFGAAIEQRRELEPDHLDSIFWAFLALGVLLTALSVVAAPWVSRFLDMDDLTPVLRWLSLGFLLQMVSGVQVSLRRRELQIKELTRINLSAAAAGGIVGVTLAFAGFGVWALVGQRLLMRVLTVVQLWLSSEWQPRWRFSWSHLREMSGFGLSVMGNRLLNYLNRQFDQLLVGRVLGQVALGYYFSASRLHTMAINMLVGTFSQVAMPAFSQLQDDPPRFRRAFAKACRYTTMVAFPVFVGLSLLAHELVTVVVGEQWLPVVPAMQVLALTGIVHSIQYVNGSAMMALGRADLSLVILLIHSLANVVGFLLAVQHGFVAVAVAYTIRAYLLAPLDLLVNRRLGALEFRQLGRAIRAPAVAALVMAGTVWILRTRLLVEQGDLLRLVISVLAGMVVYVACLLLVDRSYWDEGLELVRNLRPDSAASTSEEQP